MKIRATNLQWQNLDIQQKAFNIKAKGKASLCRWGTILRLSNLSIEVKVRPWQKEEHLLFQLSTDKRAATSKCLMMKMLD